MPSRKSVHTDELLRCCSTYCSQSAIVPNQIKAHLVSIYCLLLVYSCYNNRRNTASQSTNSTYNVSDCCLVSGSNEFCTIIILCKYELTKLDYFYHVCNICALLYYSIPFYVDNFTLLK